MPFRSKSIKPAHSPFTSALRILRKPLCQYTEDYEHGETVCKHGSTWLRTEWDTAMGRLGRGGVATTGNTGLAQFVVTGLGCSSALRQAQSDKAKLAMQRRSNLSGPKANVESGGRHRNSELLLLYGMLTFETDLQLTRKY